jgi:tetratricopeptide (TPR) repeat protein
MNDPQYLDAYIKVIRFLHSLETDRILSIIWQTPGDCGLDESAIIDYGHFSNEGAYAFTQRLFNELRFLGLSESLIRAGSGGSGGLTEEIENLEEHTRTNPQDYEALYKLGNLYSSTNVAKAIKCYEASLSIRPDYDKAKNALIRLYSKPQSYEKALSLLMNMKEHKPDNPDVFYNIACIKARQGHTKESIEFLNQAVSRGFKDRNLLVADKDLDSIKDSPLFREIIRRLN